MTVARDDITRMLFPTATEEQLREIREVLRQHHVAADNDVDRSVRVQELAAKIRGVIS